MDRRDFMKTSVVVGAYAVLGSPWAAAKENQEPWFDRPMRWAQLVLVENDPGRFDPDFWLDYFKRIHADATCLSAGGVVCVLSRKDPHCTIGVRGLRIPTCSAISFGDVAKWEWR